MGRHRALKLPFKLKLKSNTIYSIFSLICLMAFFITLFSFNQKAEALDSIREWLNFYFGRGAFFFPIIFLFASGVLIQSKKLKFIKPNWFVGYILVFFAYITVLNTGEIGITINEQSSALISQIGTIVVFSILVLIGLLIIFEVSLQDFLKLLVGIFTLLNKQFQQLFKSLKKVKLSKQEEKNKKNNDLDFVGSQQPKNILPTYPQQMALVKDNTTKNIVKTNEPLIKAKTQGGLVWKYPSLDLLDVSEGADADRGDVKKNSDIIEETLDSFGIKARVSDINYGPAITQYAIQIAKGINLSKITSLSNNLALALAAPNGQIRIEAPIPGKALIGIEIPNIRSQVVTLRKMLSAPEFNDRNKPLLVPMGIDVAGQPILIEINKMPHVLVAGTTGSGKSVMLSAWIATLLFRTSPQEVGLILIDPKRVTFMMFEGIPHLRADIITDPKETLSALKWAVSEMEERYKILADARSRDIFTFNENCKNPEDKMQFIIICIDELADLMMYASKEVEDAITRIAQKARAVGIYLVVATQRPSVDVITGLMKANIPARIAFNVSSMIDSRVIIDMPGAEKLLGRGDMLFMSPDQSKPKRIQGPFVSETEIKNIVDYLKTNNSTTPTRFTEEITKQPIKTTVDTKGNVSVKVQDKDPLFMDAVKLIVESKKASASLLQRRFSIGYARAARILDELQEAGVVGQQDASKPREVLISSVDDILNKQS